MTKLRFSESRKIVKKYSSFRLTCAIIPGGRIFRHIGWRLALESGKQTLSFKPADQAQAKIPTDKYLDKIFPATDKGFQASTEAKQCPQSFHFSTDRNSTWLLLLTATKSRSPRNCLASCGILLRGTSRPAR